VVVEFNDLLASVAKDAVMLGLIRRLMDDRIILSPLESVSQERLHRFIVRRGNKYTINLPMDGSSVSSEAIISNLPKCGLFSLACADTWSSYLLGSEPGISLSLRRVWMEMSAGYSDEDNCRIEFKQGMQYGKPWSGTSLALKNVLPDSTIARCPWTNETLVQLSLPKSVSVLAQPENAYVQETDYLRIYALEFPLDPTLPIIQLGEESSWSDLVFGRIDKIIHRPLGAASAGSISTMVINEDVYEAQIELFDIIPSYIRLSSVDLSGDAFNHQQVYESLGTDSYLLQHKFILSPHSSARLTVGYDPMLLPFQRFPPDPNRGMELPPSWAIWNSTNTVYSSSLLLLPPVPDMSMPFNIISLTCTLYAFIIGSIVNTLVRRAEDKVYYQLHPEEKPMTATQKLKEKLRAFRSKLKMIGRGMRTSQHETSGEVTGDSEKTMTDKFVSEPKDTDDVWIPDAKLIQEEDDTPHILNQGQRQGIASSVLPVSVSTRRWKRVYSLERDGDSFETFLSKIRGQEPTLLVVKTTKDHLFGGFADQAWKRQRDYFGSGQSCLFRIQGQEVIPYRWTGRNRFIQHLDVEKSLIGMGGGSTGSFGLCIEKDFLRGSTETCETFDNEPLCSDSLFDVRAVDVYAFVRGIF
jgi:hypothetical protein